MIFRSWLQSSMPASNNKAQSMDITHSKWWLLKHYNNLELTTTTASSDYSQSAHSTCSLFFAIECPQAHMQKFQFVWLHVTIWRDKLELLWRLHASSEATLAGALPVCSGFGASLHDAGKLSSPAYELSNH